ncbi:hypothetical protein L21SP5_00200 [Salinivirga cyanobacteriivorans]|uniref:DUF5675 domain-containing protein n=1 Tax=Salinivirga cyanobacteriivorans TaxID=1307839 RepID=A0A0S2HV07_9BACT|nr:hypothetical protein L21SP5_00200 [Salinivirga cyanobacteriivorans]
MDTLKNAYANGSSQVSYNYSTAILYHSSVQLGDADPIQIQVEFYPRNQEVKLNPGLYMQEPEDHIYQQDGDFTSLHFEGIGTGGHHVLHIDVDSENVELLKDYLFEDSIIEINIITTLISDNEVNTISSFNIDNGQVVGCFIERDGIPEEEQWQQGKLKRIPENEYEFIEDPCETGRSNCANEFRLITTPEKSGTRNGILIHLGTDYLDSEGCLLPVGTNYSSEEVDFDINGDLVTLTVYKSNGTSLETLTEINNYIEQKKQFAEQVGKTIKMYIDINR